MQNKPNANAEQIQVQDKLKTSAEKLKTNAGQMQNKCKTNANKRRTSPKTNPFANHVKCVRGSALSVLLKLIKIEQIFNNTLTKVCICVKFNTVKLTELYV